MHQLLSLKLKIWVIVVIAAFVATIARLADLGPLSMGVVVGIVEFVVVYLLTRSWPLLHLLSWLPRPGWAKTNLSGAWAGTLQSQWRASPGDAPLAPIPVTLDLRQGWNEVVFSLRTDKMRSRGSAATPTYDVTTHEIQFRYFFETSPTAESTETNPPQKLGSAIACVSLDRPDCMTITYTNERSAGGDIVLERVASKVGARKRKRQHALTTQAHA
ncbi:MAG: SMODS-associating beta-strand rich effector domain [Bradyrhizobium sp.]|jgi:hypothetical protein|nr:SMODS-associating beta-strand rich effector domain [Bradyrhizobium sp.]